MITISHEYLYQQKELHNDINYGTASIGYAPLVFDILRKIGGKSLSDYGAGKQNLLKALKKIGLENIDYYPFDPAFPEYGPPSEADLVCCIDVLEHIEPEYIDRVIEELARITIHFGIYTIATGPAMKVLNDGRNAHLIQKRSSWWLSKLVKYFEIVELRTNTENSFWVIVKPKIN